ncbi:homeobox-containing protein 1-like isoform X2 [Ornithodoros turicata]|uniref:homeobox-containing protein 1-like isoform X2 n=1 Tax=Ornithodoros turicata TaxID=34597 RepID=UPI00313A3799
MVAAGGMSEGNSMAGILFTIEQIELIRRLRASGITREQVVMAFEQLDRLDGELGTGCPIPPLLAARMAGRLGPYGGGGVASYGEQWNNGVARGFSAGREPPQNASSNDSTAVETPHNGDMAHSPQSNKLPSELTIIPISTAGSPGAQGEDGNGGSLVTTSGNAVPMQYLMNPHDLLQEESADIEDLKRKGEAAILSEIRNFVMRYNIKQTMIAEMTKLSQAYVSRFFRGDIADMSDRTKNTFYMWYLTCKNNPWKLAQLCPNSGVKRMVSETGDLIPLKRERFTFKSAHLAVLERYYERDPYPDAQTREQIVEECNEAVERPERPLTEREKVSLSVVNNWFNNRRKEAKKQLRQQHAAAMAAAASAGMGNLSSVLGGGGQKSPFPMSALGWGANLFPAVSSSAAALAAIGASQCTPAPSSVQEGNSHLMRGNGSDQGDSGGGPESGADSDISQDSASLPSYGHESEPAATDFSDKVTVKQET